MSLPDVLPKVTSDSPPLWVHLAAFLSRKAPNTRTTYAGVLAEWCRFLGVEPGTSQAAARMLDATDLEASAYGTWLEQQPGQLPRSGRVAKSESREITTEQHRPRRATKKVGLEATQTNATIHKKFAALRRMYRVLIGHKLGIEKNPFDRDVVPPPPKDAGRKRPTEMVPFDRVIEIIESPDAANPKGVRDRAILAVLFGGGIRRSEITALRLGDVRFSGAGTLYLYLRHTKAKRDADQALPEWVEPYLISHLMQRRADGGVEDDFLFTGYTGKAGKRVTSRPISDAGVYLLFKHYCAAAGVFEFVSPHSARATAITKLLADGVPHREVQEFSRHSSIQMVEVYDKRRFGVDESPAKGLTFTKRGT